jgi:hypothetical protein
VYRSHLLGALCAAVFVVLANTAHAAVINPIFGLNIGGTLYNVTFHDGVDDSFNAIWDADNNGVFDSAAPTFWGDEAGALAAAEAIVTLLGTADATTSQAVTDAFLIPVTTRDTGIQITAGQDIIRSARDTATALNVDGVIITVCCTTDTTTNVLTPYATFAVVPIPPAIWLFGSGLIGLIGIARRKKS